jgi:nucleotide-binding universal stress UspA family protein
MPYRCIVAGTDGSKSATESVRHAAAIAAQCDAVIHIVGAYRDLTWSETHRARSAVPVGLDIDHVADPRAEVGDILDDTAHAIRDYHPRVWLHAVKSDPSTALDEVAVRKGADLIVVGNRGIADPWPRFRKPICEQVRRRASCEVLVVDTAKFWRAPSGAGLTGLGAAAALAQG